MTFTIFNCPLFTFSKNIDIIGWGVIWAGYYIEKNVEPSPSLPNCLKDSWKLLPLLVAINWPVWWLNELCFKRYSQKYILSHVLILLMTSQICWIMGWLKIQKLEYLQSETYLFHEIKKFLTSASDNTFWEVIVL